MQIGVYIIKHLSTDCFYIGSTTNLDLRKRQHLFLLRKGTHRNPKLQQCFTQSQEIVWEFIPTASYDEALTLEHSMIKGHWGNSLLCNEIYMDESKGVVVSGNFRARMSEAKKGIPQSEEHKAALAQSRKGKSHSPEWVEKVVGVTRIKVEVNGVVYNSATEAAAVNGCTVMTVMNRVRNPKAKYANWKFVE